MSLKQHLARICLKQNQELELLLVGLRTPRIRSQFIYLPALHSAPLSSVFHLTLPYRSNYVLG